VQWSNLAGYFVAAVVAEVWFARASSPSGRAVLERRKLADYLPQPARLLPRCIAGTAAVLAVTYELLPYRPPHFEFSGERIAWRYYAGTGSHYRVSGAVAIGVVVVVELLQRAVVHRRQQYASESLLRADDSLRAWSLRILASVSITVTSTMVAFMLVPIGFKSGLVSLDGSFDALMSLAGLSPLVIALITFRSLSRPLSPWRVPRLRAVQPA